MQEKMILDNVNLIYIVLKKYGLYSNIDEYYDLGMIGLVKGVKTFDASKGFAPSTYLVSCITKEILAYCRKQQAKKRTSGKQDISIYDCIARDINGNEQTIIDITPSNEDVEKNLIKKEQLELFYKEISNLKEKDKYVICSNYGLMRYKELTQREIAKKIGISQAQVNRIIKKFIEKVRREYE